MPSLTLREKLTLFLFCFVEVRVASKWQTFAPVPFGVHLVIFGTVRWFTEHTHTHTHPNSESNLYPLPSLPPLRSLFSFLILVSHGASPPRRARVQHRDTSRRSTATFARSGMLSPSFSVTLQRCCLLSGLLPGPQRSEVRDGLREEWPTLVLPRQHS